MRELAFLTHSLCPSWCYHIPSKPQHKTLEMPLQCQMLTVSWTHWDLSLLSRWRYFLYKVFVLEDQCSLLLRYRCSATMSKPWMFTGDVYRLLIRESFIATKTKKLNNLILLLGHMKHDPALNPRSVFPVWQVEIFLYFFNANKYNTFGLLKNRLYVKTCLHVTWIY